MYPDVRVPAQFRTLPPGDSTQPIDFLPKGSIQGDDLLSTTSSSCDEDVLKVDGKDLRAYLAGAPKVEPAFPTEDGSESVESSQGSFVFHRVYVPFVDAVPDFLKMDPSALAIAFGVVMSLLSFATILMNIVFLALGINLVG
jgi:hypothetical protein